MLTRLCNDLFEIRAERRTGGLVLCFDPNFNPGCVEFTPAEVLALADELRRMAQTTPAHEVSTKDQYEDPITSTTPGWAAQVVPIPKEPAP